MRQRSKVDGKDFLIGLAIRLLPVVALLIYAGVRA
jgi:hypothetical protein